MANFCPKCGGPLLPNAGFCPSCGTSVAATGPSVAPVPEVAATGYAPVNTQPPPNAPPSQTWGTQGQYPGPGTPAAYPGSTPGSTPGSYPGSYPGAPPAKGNGLKIVLIVVAILVGIGIVGAAIVSYSVYRVVHTVRNSVDVDDKGNFSLNAAAGGLSMGKNVTASEAELGVPVFPGATRGQGGLRMKTRNGSMVTVIYKTTADVDAVVSYYKSKMPGADEASSDTNGATVLKTGKPNDQTMVTIGRGTGSESSTTSIVIVRVTQPAK
jgi:hypothetical protein